MASVAEQIATLRRSAVASRLGRDALLRVEGSSALDVLDRLLPSEMFIRHRGARQSLLLNEEGRVEADLMLLADGDNVTILAEGMDGEGLRERILQEARPGEALSVRALDDHAVIDLNGPFAWQVLADFADDGAVGLRFLSWFLLPEQLVCLRAGLAGEYGYSFLVPRAREEALFQRLMEVGAAVDIVEAGAEAMRHCRLEAWFFDVAREPLACPLEWGLQWRIQWDKEFRGARALGERRRAHPRAVAFQAERLIPAGTPILLDGEPIGRVACSSDLREPAIGAAILQPFFAQSGVTAYMAGGSPITTVSPPFVRYQSLRAAAGRSRYVRPA